MNRIRGKILDDFALDMLDEGLKDNFMRLNSKEAALVRKPRKFVELASLDDKIVIANKLNKKIFIVVIDEEAGLESRDFALVFRKPFIDKETDKDAIELLNDKGMLVIGNETVSKYLQRAELLLNTDMYSVARLMRKLKGKQGITATTFNNKEYELKNLFMRTILRMFFAGVNMDVYFKFMNLTQVEFGIICILWLAGRPMDTEETRVQLNHLMNLKRNDLRKHMNILNLKGHIVSTAKESAHVHGRRRVFMLSIKGHGCVEQFIKKVTAETIATHYE